MPMKAMTFLLAGIVYPAGLIFTPWLIDILDLRFTPARPLLLYGVMLGLSVCSAVFAGWYQAWRTGIFRSEAGLWADAAGLALIWCVMLVAARSLDRMSYRIDFGPIVRFEWSPSLLLGLLALACLARFGLAIGQRQGKRHHDHLLIDRF